MVKLVIDMNRLSKQLSVGTQQLSQQAVSAAQAAAASIVAGLRTCDERSGGILNNFELQVDEHPATSSVVAVTQSLTIPSTSMALSSTKVEPYEGDTWGTYTFQFKLKLQVEEEHAGYLCASAYYTNGSVVPLRCRWKRKIGGVFFDIHDFYGTYVFVQCVYLVFFCVMNRKYPISADDVGARVVVEAKPVKSDSDSCMVYVQWHF